MGEENKLDTLELDISEKILRVNGENMKRVSRLELTFEDGEWTLLISRDDVYTTTPTKSKE